MTGKFEQKFKEQISQKDYIKSLINRGENQLAREKLADYKLRYLKDVDTYSMEAILFISENKLSDAENRLKVGLELRPFNFDLNFNLAYVYQLKNYIFKSLDHYLITIRCANNDDEIQEVVETLNQMSYDIDISNLSKEDYNLLKNKIEKINNYNPKYDNRSFPITENNELFISRAMFESEQGEGYYNNYYRSEEFLDYPTQLWSVFKNEILYCKPITQNVNLDIKENCVVPISTKSLDTILNIKVNDEKYEFETFKPNRFNYLSIDKNSKVSINSNKPFILGESLNKEDENQIRLVLPIFIDGFSQCVIQGENFEKLMPNTYKFFKDGTKFTNFYANGEWTLPSVASIFTGRYTTNHKLFNPKLNYDIGRGYPLISEKFKNESYFTFQACGDWRKSPFYGYVRGFNRTIYQSAGNDRMNCEEVIFEAIEQLRAFEDRSHFMWLSIFELHSATDNEFFKISNQINNSLLSKTKIDNSSNKSVERGFDLRRIEKYKNEIQRIDFYLSFLYRFIEERYNDDEILVMILSDHGHGFFDKEHFLLKQSKMKVPFMIKGKGISDGYCDEIMETVDIYPTLLKVCNIECDEHLDGKLPKYFGGEREKEFAYSESIYPGKVYMASISDKVHEFRFKTKKVTEKDGRIDISEYSIDLINKETKVNERHIYCDKVEKYISVVYEHIKKHIKI
jgi:hypothetical protein